MLLGESVAAVGLEVLAFADGGAALDAALENDVAIVLLDVDMPVLDGNEVCRRLRAEPRFSSVPIVIVTGHQDSDAIRRAFEAGATDFISKPVNWALLPHRLEYILRNAAAAEHIERLAYYDTLTGLPNRRRCVDLLGRLVAAAKGSSEAVAVIYLDLNNFKRVNDTFGHSVGDEVLRTVAGRLTQHVGGVCRAAPERPGGALRRRRVRRRGAPRASARRRNADRGGVQRRVRGADRSRFARVLFGAEHRHGRVSRRRRRRRDRAQARGYRDVPGEVRRRGPDRRLRARDEQPPRALVGARSQAAARGRKRPADADVPAEVQPGEQSGRRRRSAGALVRRRVRRHSAVTLRADRRGQRLDPRHERLGRARRVPPVAQMARSRRVDPRGDQLLRQRAACTAIPRA